MEQIVCPFCNGAGCDNCQNAGQITVSPQELQQLQSLGQMPALPQSQVPAYAPGANSYSSLSAGQKTLPGSRITLAEIKTKFSGLLSFLVVFSLLVGAYFSHQKFQTLLPYLAALASLFVIAITSFLSKNDFFQYHEPLDFISFVKNSGLPKPPSLQ